MIRVNERLERLGVMLAVVGYSKFPKMSADDQLDSLSISAYWYVLVLIGPTTIALVFVLNFFVTGWFGLDETTSEVVGFGVAGLCAILSWRFQDYIKEFYRNKVSGMIALANDLRTERGAVGVLSAWTQIGVPALVGWIIPIGTIFLYSTVFVERVG